MCCHHKSMRRLREIVTALPPHAEHVGSDQRGGRTHAPIEHDLRVRAHELQISEVHIAVITADKTVYTDLVTDKIVDRHGNRRSTDVARRIACDCADGMGTV